MYEYCLILTRWFTTHESLRGGFVHPRYFCGHCPHWSHRNHQGCFTHLNDSYQYVHLNTSDQRNVQENLLDRPLKNPIPSELGTDFSRSVIDQLPIVMILQVSPFPKKRIADKWVCGMYVYYHMDTHSSLARSWPWDHKFPPKEPKTSPSNSANQ